MMIAMPQHPLHQRGLSPSTTSRKRFQRPPSSEPVAPRHAPAEDLFSGAAALGRRRRRGVLLPPFLVLRLRSGGMVSVVLLAALLVVRVLPEVNAFVVMDQIHPERATPPSYDQQSSCLLRPHHREAPPGNPWSSLRQSSLRLSSSTRLFSLQPLVAEIVAQAEAASSSSTSSSSPPPVIFVGGKGGVGKTSVSAALAVALAMMPYSLKVLVVSTDPAHSLGDALDENLRRPPPSSSSSNSASAATAHAVPMTDPLTGGNLYACEVDASAALASFQDQLAAFDVDRLAASLGVSSNALDGLGLREFGGLLRNPPPGLDELVALLNVLEDTNTNNDPNQQGKSTNTRDYDVILVDTAPTGHTLRLLALPQFLDGLLGKLVKLRLKLSGLASTLQAFLGDGQAQQRAKAVDDASNRLNDFQLKMQRLRSRLRDPIRTRFVVVTIPTRLAVAESKRLLMELQSQQVRVTDVVINQCVGTLAEGDTVNANASPALQAYYDRRKAGQTKWIANLRSAVADVSASPAYQSNGLHSQPIALTEVPFFDVELVGIPALGYIGSQCFAKNPNLDHLMRMDDQGGGGASPPLGPRVVVCGGKGGVGKTTTSASLAVIMAACGHTVAIISTDPAHSLGDALDVSLAGGQLVPCPLVGVPGDTGEGSLSALEIDPSSAIKQFKGIVDQLVNGGGSGAQEDAGGLRNALKDLEEVFDTLPAGTDEVVALAKIVNLVRRGNFDRIVLDTAPTGHTLRMLSTPGFLAELIDRLLAIADKINTNPAIRLFLSAATSARRDDLDDAAATAKSQLLSFQLQMYELEDLFSDAEQTEFLIVTIATELAARESIRLLNDLTFEAPDMPIKVRNVVVNQVLSDDDSNVQTFVSHLAKSQAASVDDLQRSVRALTHPPRITQVPYLDTEPRGVYGLKILADELQKEDAIVVAPVL